MMRRFVMHQKENIKEFNSCTELCGGCIGLVWKVLNASHTPQEHIRAFSVQGPAIAHHCFLEEGVTTCAVQHPSRQTMQDICGEGKINQGTCNPAQQSKCSESTKPCELLCPETPSTRLAGTGRAALQIHARSTECSILPSLPSEL